MWGFLVSSYCLLVKWIRGVQRTLGFCRSLLRARSWFTLCQDLDRLLQKEIILFLLGLLGRIRRFLAFFGIDEGLGFGDEDGRSYARCPGSPYLKASKTLPRTRITAAPSSIVMALRIAASPYVRSPTTSARFASSRLAATISAALAVPRLVMITIGLSLVDSFFRYRVVVLPFHLLTLSVCDLALVQEQVGHSNAIFRFAVPALRRSKMNFLAPCFTRLSI